MEDKRLTKKRPGAAWCLGVIATVDSDRKGCNNT